MSDDLLYQDPRFRALTASQRSALQLLPKLVASYGRDGVLHWTRKEVREAVQLGANGYAALLSMLARHEWAIETAEGWLVLSLPSREAERAKIIEEARPGIIREYENGRKQKSRTQTPETSPAVVPDISGTFPGHFRDNAPAYIDTHARAFESNSNRFEEEINISIDSIRFDSKEPLASGPLPPPPVSLAIVPADIIQAMGRYGILEQNARQLLVEFGSEACTRVLAAIPYWKPKNTAARIYVALRNPDAWKWPADLTQGSLPLLTNQPGGVAPRAEAKPPAASLKSLRESLTDAELKLLRCEAVDRLKPVERAEYDKAIGLNRDPPVIVMDSITAIENNLLRATRQRVATG